MDQLGELGIGLEGVGTILVVVLWLVFTFYLAPKLGIPT
jgi:hypothetical protein